MGKITQKRCWILVMIVANIVFILLGIKFVNYGTAVIGRFIDDQTTWLIDLQRDVDQLKANDNMCLCVAPRDIYYRYDKEEPDNFMGVWNIPFSSEFQTYIRTIAEDHGVDPNLIFATIHVETGGTFSYDVVSTNGKGGSAVYGLGQIDPYWTSAIKCQKEFSSERGGYYAWPEDRDWELLDPYENVHLMIVIFEYYQNMGITDLHKLAMCYNGNEGYARDRISSDYSKKVVDIYNQLTEGVY